MELAAELLEIPTALNSADDSSVGVSSLPDDDDDDDEEEVCRVCRCPAEEGLPLFKPCMCSGSIGFVHQSCLESWLNHQRRDGSCELCRTKFQFAPQYAENTPKRLRLAQVITSLCRRFVEKLLPMALRSLFASSLWLIVGPLVTSYLYHLWMARPSALLQRFTWDLIISDVVSGAVVAACIIISFLSLMSFADFLRGEWQQRGQGGRAIGALDLNQPNNLHGNRNNRNARQVVALDNNSSSAVLPSDESVNNSIWDYAQSKILQQPNRENSPRVRRILASEHDTNNMTDKILFPDPHDEPLLIRKDTTGSRDGSSNNDVDDNELFVSDDDSNASKSESEGLAAGQAAYIAPIAELPEINRDQALLVRAGEFEDGLQPVLLPDRREELVPDRARVAPAIEFDQDEPIDMDINIALDELLGVRGPLVVVARNLLWLLAFNAVFLGFFAFVPRTVGVAMSSILFNGTDLLMSDFAGNTTEDIMNHFNISQSFSFSNAWKAIEAESIHRNTALRLHDVSTVALGYFSLAFAVVVFRYLWVISQKIPFLRERRDRAAYAEDMREAIDEMNRLVQGLGNDAPNLGEDPPVIALSLALGVALDAMQSIVKVGSLLFLKMFLLPIVLGLTLDIATIPVFGGTLGGRVGYAGMDLFAFILLHWVAGITFMLLVTVSVLQLREVVHPDLVSQMIRPQEPQPDLLGNLMHESITTHTKRMLLSMVIYAFLLTIHIYLPVRLLDGVFGSNMPLLILKFSYILTPQLQVPLELVFFHLCMLALLEKYKNCLGGIQHHWLKLTTEFIGLSDGLLPKKVKGFRLIGSRIVFESDISLDPFWLELTKGEKNATAILEHETSTFHPPDAETFKIGETKTTGQRVLQLSSDSIRLPVRLPGRSFRVRETFLATTIGKYRLSTSDLNLSASPAIELWEEVPGESINRPPEGWDDLGVGGADIQGRWAWGNETKSSVELGLAARRPFFNRRQSLKESVVVGCKLGFIILLSWFASTLLLGIFFTTPLVVGRSLCSILRIPDSWVHDPLAFCVGFMLVFPFVKKSVRVIMSTELTLSQQLSKWMRCFKVPPGAKICVLMEAIALWFVISPCLIGVLYDIAFVCSSEWFLGHGEIFGVSTLVSRWALGTVLLYAWSDLCIVGLSTRDFRFFGEVRDPPGEGADMNVNTAGNIGDSVILRLSWQGKQGRLALFWNTWDSIFFNWEWDKVDRDILVKNSSGPVAFQLFVCLFFIVASLNCVCLGFTLSGFGRAVFMRSILFLYCCITIGRTWSDHLQLWFEAAHTTARDESYLIGKTLLNYKN